jgi:hypothetical protein
MRAAARFCIGLTMLGANLLCGQVKRDEIEGKWIADNGKGPPQTFVFEVRGEKISGVVCGPCDPAHVFLIEDGSVTGDKITFYIRHDDRGQDLAKYGPHRNIVTGTIAGNEIRARWHREGGGENEDPHGEMVLIGPLRLQPRPPRPAPAAQQAPQPPAK